LPHAYAGTAVHEPRTEGIGYLHDTWKNLQIPWQIMEVLMGKSWGNPSDQTWRSEKSFVDD
jgi:hypothetical protein